MSAYRYWGVLQTGDSWYAAEPKWQFLWEMEFFAKPDGSGSDLTTGKTAQASLQQAGYEASKLIDDNTGTAWTYDRGATAYQKIWVDFGSPVACRSWSVSCQGAYGYGDAHIGKKLMVIASSDATNWINIKEYSIANSINVKQVFTNIQILNQNPVIPSIIVY